MKNNVELMSTKWARNIYWTGAGVQELVAAPGAGLRIVLTRLVLISAAATIIRVGYGGITILGPIPTTADSLFIDLPLPEGVLLPENESLTIESDTSGITHVYVNGMINPV